jgi:predicted HTH domain antitoxin
MSQRHFSVTLENDVADLFGESPEQITQSLVEAGVLDLFRRHVISRGRAAEILGLNYVEFLQLSNAAGIPYFDWDDENIEQELRAIDLP